MAGNPDNSGISKKRGNNRVFYINKLRGRGGGRFFRGRGGSNQNKIPVKVNGEKQESVTSWFSQNPSAYPGWKLYHTEESYNEESITTHKVKSFENYVRNHKVMFPSSRIEETLEFNIDLKHLCDDINFTSSWTDFKDDLKLHPEQTLNCLGLGMHQVIITDLHLEASRDQPDELSLDSISLPKVYARVVNFEPILLLKNLNSNYYGKLVALSGTIIRIGNIKLLCTWMTFECNSCHNLQCVKQPEGLYTLPTSCNTERCRSRSFVPHLSNSYTQTLDWQSVKLQEIVGDDQREKGRVPRTIECELTAGMVDSCTPGDVVTITGIVKVKNSEDLRKKSGNVFSLYIEAVSLQNKKNQSSARRFTTTFNLRDYYAIKEIHSQPQLFRLIVNSLCPTIYGHEMVKAGLLLGLFGGCQHHTDARSDPHVLVVGDPGLGKSQMLQACANVAPRGVYVCGNTSTSSGLTVTVCREAGGDYVLEAGALVLSDQGSCCIDEFDKMTTQHNALLEAMEQQTISVAKAGVVCSLPARTSILAAANPVGGHYSKAKTVSENLKLGPALLSRFDLVFILLDQPNEQLDGLLSEHVMALHSGLKSNTSHTSDSFVNLNTQSEEISLVQRLKCLPGENLDLVPHQLLRKYIAYARKYVKPKLSSEAAHVLQDFYLLLRRQHCDMDCTPVTTRQLESLIRLTQARAKLELREEATQTDAEDVVEIMKYSLVDTFTDEMGMLDFTRSQNGSGMSSRNQAKKFAAMLQKKAELLSRSVFSVKELKEIAGHVGIQTIDFSNILSSLNIQGLLIKKGNQLYQLVSADY